MTDLHLLTYGTGAIVLTGWVAILAFAGLKGWNGWLAFKRAELDAGLRHAHEPMPAPPSAMTRIDIADLKERIRKLEAIASGVDL